MSLFFLLHNFHFALEIFGALVFLAVAWLAFDAFLLRRDFLTASRGIGFFCLIAFQVAHALAPGGDTAGYVGFFLLFLGLSFVVLNLVLEKPVARPQFEAVLVLPVLGAVAPFAHAFAAVLYWCVAALSFRQYKMEFKKSLKPFWTAFCFLGAGAAVAVFYTPDFPGWLWMIGHGFEFAGFIRLAVWVWQYLALRIREEMVLIFVAMSLFVSILVTATFSFLLIGRVENDAAANLLLNARVLDLAVGGLRKEALAKVRLLALRGGIAPLLARNDFVGLERVLADALAEEELGFLTAIDARGEVAWRAHSTVSRGDSARNEQAVSRALAGEDFATVESSSAEKFSIRAASPLRVNGKTVGVLVGGFPLDNAFADRMKRVTGLEMSVFEGDARVATTALNPDGRTRSVGIREINPEVRDAVLRDGNPLTLRTEMLSRPFLASYLPLRDGEGTVVGMLSSAKPQKEILDLVNASNRITFLTVAVLMLALAFPLYLATKRLGEEVS